MNITTDSDVFLKSTDGCGVAQSYAESLWPPLAMDGKKVVAAAVVPRVGKDEVLKRHRTRWQFVPKLGNLQNRAPGIHVSCSWEFSYTILGHLLFVRSGHSKSFIESCTAFFIHVHGVSHPGRVERSSKKKTLGFCLKIGYLSSAGES